MNKIISLIVILSFITVSCTSTHSVAKENSIQKLKFLDLYVVPYNQSFENTTIGGLSGIDYVPEKNSYYLISDDRAEKNHVRFYTTQININNNKIDTVIFTGVTFLKDKLGKYYPNSREDAMHTPDPEAMRYNPKKNLFTWSSEGERIINSKKMILENPAVTECDINGNYLDTFQLPKQVIMNAGEFGPRQNGVFEGLTFDKDYQNLFVSVEEPLYQDGPRAGNSDSSGIIRIIKFNENTKKPVAQYAYMVDPVAYPAITPSAFKINGISDILWAGNNTLLVIERSFSTGRLGCTIKIYEANIDDAKNIENISSIKGMADLKFISKKLLLNMDDLGIYIDNIEGVTFGPLLPNGKRSLIFVADNNFNAFERTQFLLFEIE